MKMKKDLLLSMLMVMMPLMVNAGMNDNWDKAKQKLAPLYKYADRYEDKLKGDEGYLIFNNISNPDSLTDLNIEADLNAYITLIGQGQTGELSIPRELYNPDIEVEIGDDVFYSKYNFTYYRVGNDTKSIAFDNETISDITQKYGYVSCNDFYYLAPPTPTTNPIVEIKLQGNMPSAFDKTKIEQPAQVMSGKYDICVIMVPDWYKTLTELEMTDANEMTDGKFFDSAYIDSISAISKMSFTCQLRYNDNAANGRDITSAKSSTIEYDGKRVDTLLVFEDFEFPYSYKNLNYNYPTLRIEGATNSRMGKQGFLHSLCIDRVIMKSKESGEEIIISPKDPVSFTMNQMATIILPTTPDASKGKYYRLDRCEEGKVIFTEEREPKARTPYIIVPNEDFSIDLDKLELEGLYCDSTNIVGVSFIGTYNKKVFGYKDSFYYHILDSTPDCRDDVGKYLYVGPLRAFLEIDWRKNNHQNLEEMEVVLQDIPNDIVLHNHPKYYQDGDYWVQALVPWDFEERIHDYETAGSGENFSLYFFYVEGDTIIDNKEYKCVHAKTWVYDCEETYNHQPEGLIEGVQVSNLLFMREDADGKQWRRLSYLTDEALLFDFSHPFEKGQVIRFCKHDHLSDVLENVCYESVQTKACSNSSRLNKALRSDDKAPEGYLYYNLEVSNVTTLELPNGEQVPFANGRIAFGWGDVYQGDLFHQFLPLCESLKGMFLYRVHQGQVILQNKNNIIKINDIIGKDVLSLFNKPKDANKYFTKNQMATIILPTEPDASKGRYYRLDRCEKGKIIFEEELSPKARTPYIIVPKEDFSIDLNALDLDGLLRDTVSVKGASFIGSYGHEELSCQDGFYIDIIDATPDCQADDSNQRKAIVGALRACLIVNWDDPYNPGGSKGITGKRELVLKDNPNGIGSLTPNPSPSEKGTIYDLSGRKVNSQSSMFNLQSSMFNGLKKGLYIVNGRKIAIK